MASGVAPLASKVWRRRSPRPRRWRAMGGRPRARPGKCPGAAVICQASALAMASNAPAPAATAVRTPSRRRNRPATYRSFAPERCRRATRSRCALTQARDLDPRVIAATSTSASHEAAATPAAMPIVRQRWLVHRLLSSTVTRRPCASQVASDPARFARVLAGERRRHQARRAVGRQWRSRLDQVRDRSVRPIRLHDTARVSRRLSIRGLPRPWLPRPHRRSPARRLGPGPWPSRSGGSSGPAPSGRRPGSRSSGTPSGTTSGRRPAMAARRPRLPASAADRRGIGRSWRDALHGAFDQRHAPIVKLQHRGA